MDAAEEVGDEELQIDAVNDELQQQLVAPAVGPRCGAFASAEQPADSGIVLHGGRRFNRGVRDSRTGGNECDDFRRHRVSGERGWWVESAEGCDLLGRGSRLLEA